ncbi:Hsp20/alpha crystallin family protein [Actinokineospora iranica]|uniref:Heat shock protein Hsp20 n=1 Tax=Actinokineospora iranica TaxID=1271860 RepID=A0A1G6S9R1_9PSEU|nr:Hsp20/alpha crystallin family protein [Actinokineospora iranica]SDD13662.1 heat shock protein Hsp20 [Actinokineospora iranica]
MALPAVRSGNQVGRWDPFREFEDLYSQLGRWMDSALGRLDQGIAWAPLADVTEVEDAYVVEVDLPGVKREDVAIELVGNDLVVTGELKQKERQGLLRHRTRRTGEFSYRVTLPDSVDADKVEASLDEGVLTIRVAKSEAAKPRRIAIRGT